MEAAAQHGAPASAAPASKLTLTADGDVRPGKPARLMFHLSVAKTGQPVNAAVEHEKPMHLIIARRDLAHFAHLHPEPTGTVGEYAVTHTFPAAGDYVLYGEFMLPGGADEVHSFAVGVVAPTGAAAALVPDLAPQQSGGYTATIAPQGAVRAGDLSQFVVRLTRDGAPATDLEPYLGAASHVVVLNQYAARFAHVHAVAGEQPPGAAMGEMADPPARFGPAVAFSHRFPEPGLYKVWLQFAHGGQVETVAWVVEVK
jgi:Cu+-exporting ATPase